MRLVITIFLFVTIASVTDLTSSFKMILSLSPKVILGCFFLLLGQLLITSTRWHLLIKSMSGTLPLKNCLRLYWIGIFFSQMLPTSIGGDVVRAMLVDRKYFSAKKTLASIILERFIGLGTLVIVALFYLLPLLSELEIPSQGIYILMFIFIFCTCLLVFMKNNSFVKRLREFVFAILYECGNGFSIIIKQPLTLFKILVLSIASHGLAITVAYYLIIHLHGVLPIFPVIGSMACAMLLAALPLSISGWGLREGTMLILLTQVGVSAEAAIASGVALGVITLLFSLPGGILYIQK